MNWEGWTGEGVQFAALTGDPFLRAYMAMVRLPCRPDQPAQIKIQANNVWPGCQQAPDQPHHAVELGAG